jgi:putative hydrolase of the HAD superfamily
VGSSPTRGGTEPFDPYAGYHLHERFDAVIVLGEVGIRKPDPAIYRLAAEKLGLPIGACVLVDDVAANLTPAAELGMASIHHTDSAATVRGA